MAIYWPTPTLKGERLRSVFSPDGTLISASAAPHCGAADQWPGLDLGTYRSMTRSRLTYRSMTWSRRTYRSVTWSRLTLRSVTWSRRTYRSGSWSRITYRSVTWSRLTARLGTWSRLTYRSVSWFRLTYKSVTRYKLTYRPVTWSSLTYRSVSLLVGALSPINHKGLHQGWTQISLYLQVIHFTSHHTTSHVLLVFSYLYSAGTWHGNLHPTGYLSYSTGLHRKRC